MNGNDELIALMMGLKAQIEVTNTQISNLMMSVQELKIANEDRRSSIDLVASSLREAIKKVEEPQTKMLTEFNILKWVVGILVASVITLAVGKVWGVIMTDIQTIENHSKP